MQRFQVAKADRKLGVVFGWAIVCKENGEDYFDRQGDHIPETCMLEAAVQFAENGRMAKEMHSHGDTPNSMFVFPLTEEIAEGFGIRTDKTGLMVMLKASPEMLSKFESGQYTGFSIGGQALEFDEVDVP